MPSPPPVEPFDPEAESDIGGPFMGFPVVTTTGPDSPPALATGIGKHYH